MKQKLIEIRRKTDNSRITIRYVNSPHTAIKEAEGIRKDKDDLKNIINQLDLIDIYREL